VRLSLLASVCLLAFLLCAPAAMADAAAWTHGPDPRSIDRGPAPLPPKGGPKGKRLHAAARARASAATVRSDLPSSWCGDEIGYDDVAHQLQNGDFRYHGVYVVPADAPDRFRTFAPRLQSAAFEASGLLERLYGRAIRFDMGTSCGPQYLDISVIRLQETGAALQQLAGDPMAYMTALGRDLQAAGFQNVLGGSAANGPLLDRNMLIWVDGPAPADACGEATSYTDARRQDDNLNNQGGKLAAVFLDGSDFCGGTTVRHEIGHTMGAVQPGAPHLAAGGHCSDAYEDTMCLPTAPRVAGGDEGLFFDYGNDDYWDPPAGPALGWWTADLNRFLCPDATCNVPAPAPAPAAAPPVAAPKAAAVPAKLQVRVSRHRRFWRLSMRARGTGHALLTVRCRARKARKASSVFIRETALPKRLVARVRCGTRPRAKLTRQTL
jgi:hypothetical protein